MTTTNHNVIGQEFDFYASKTIHPEAKDNQINDLRNTFYAGAYMMLVNLSKISHESDDDAGRAIDMLEQEIESYFMKLEKEHSVCH